MKVMELRKELQQEEEVMLKTAQLEMKSKY